MFYMHARSCGCSVPLKARAPQARHCRTRLTWRALGCRRGVTALQVGGSGASPDLPSPALNRPRGWASGVGRRHLLHISLLGTCHVVFTIKIGLCWWARCTLMPFTKDLGPGGLRSMLSSLTRVFSLCTFLFRQHSIQFWLLVLGRD